MTGRDEIHDRLFTTSGCLKLDVLQKYNSSGLTDYERVLADTHLKECELCSDALEGLALVNNQDKLSSLITEINENISKNLLKEKATDKSKTIKIYDRIFYYAAAASILILFGIFSYFKFNWKPIKELSVVTEQTKKEEIRETPQTFDKKNKEIIIQQDVEPEVPHVIKPVTQKQKSHESAIAEKQIIKTEPKTIPDKQVEDESYLAENESTEGVIEQTADELLIDSSVDIASAGQPVEYYISGVVVSGEAITGDELSEYEVAPQINSQAMGAKSSEYNKNQKSISRIASGQEDSQESISDTYNSTILEPENESGDAKAVFVVVEQIPEFPGGLEAMIKYLSENLNYPDSAKALGIQGTVYVSFIVNESGEVSDAQIKRGIGGDCDKEALRAIKSMPAWLPGLKKGKPVRVQLVIPVVFKLD